MSFLRALFSVVVATLAITLGTSVSAAFAEVPAWTVTSNIKPRILSPGGTGEIIVVAENLGDAITNGSPIVITDKLPAGVTPTGSYEGCEVTSSSISCEYLNVAMEPYSRGPLRLHIHVTVENAFPNAVNVVSVSGGGAQAESNSEAVSFGAAPAGFGVDKLEEQALNENGSPDTQAGSHPFGYTTTIQLNSHLSEFGEELASGALVKDLHFDLPPGLIGNPTVIPQCTSVQFATIVPGTAFGDVNSCPDDTVVGVSGVTLYGNWYVVPLFNIVPSVGEPAKFGFIVLGVPVILDTAVRSGGDYGVVVNVNNISDILQFDASQLTIWGVPSDPRHDPFRGFRCLEKGAGTNGLLGPCPAPVPGQKPGPPFLTLPTSCTGPLQSSVEADSWGTTKEIGPHEHVGEYQGIEYTWHNAEHQLGLDGCNRLPFTPSIGVTPDGSDASTPTGLLVTQHIPQDATLSPTGLAESTVKNTTVALPAGVQISPSGGDGLLACSSEQVGFGGANAQGGLEFSDDPGSCPEGSKVGTVKITTPLLPNPLTGAAYLAAQNANPFGSLVALYIVVRDPVSGILVKAAGEVSLDPTTGQIVSTFKNTPQLPYEDLELHFFGSARAPLTTPALCGPYTTHTAIEGWSGNPPSEPSSTFDITAGVGGGPCPSGQPFAPFLAAGTTNNNAGAFSPLATTFTREDGSQAIQAVRLHVPAGLSGLLSSVTLCGEQQANEGTCGPQSLIGETTVSVGLGSAPFNVTGGKVYITGPYRGAPFGLSIVNPAKAGPFDLEKGTACDCVLVRAKIEVDPQTAELTVTTDGAGDPHPIPHILDGIPLEIKHINVTISRPGFTFNPTNCEPLAMTGAITSVTGASQSLSVPFQATNCANLKFAPKFAVSTAGKTSKANGASLSVKLTYPKAPFGSQANIARVKVDLPKQLPSRLTTLQKACTAAQFAANPAGCPAASIVGHAKAVTPLLPVALEGPAYFVSHGGEAFPSLIIALQGDGVTLDVVGATFISKAGITSSTFKTVPDAPIGSFELMLPEGRYSALAANSNLCKSKLAMPTEFLAQNGAKINESTKIAVTGCPKAKKAKKRNKKGHKGKKGGKRKK